MATAAEPIEEIKERVNLIAGTKARDEIAAGAKLIDVREPHEWDEAHLEGAVHVPQGELLERISEVAPDQSERIVLYCRTDNRSSRAAAGSISSIRAFTSSIRSAVAITPILPNLDGDSILYKV